MISSGRIGKISRSRGVGKVGQGFVREGGVIGQDYVQLVSVEQRGGGAGFLGRARAGLVGSRENFVVGWGLGLFRGPR